MKHIKIFEDFVKEMGSGDIHYKNVLAHWESADAKKREQMKDVIGCKDVESLKKILRDMNYTEIVEIEKELGIEL